MRIGPQRPVNPDAVVAPQGYRVEALITGLTFPSAVSFGPGGELYLAESGGVAGSVVAVPRVLRIDPDQSVNEIGRLDNPIVGLVYRNGELLIAEDGAAPRILRVTAEGEVKILVDNLPGGGDYGITGLSLDATGGLLFGVGSRTNSGVVGLDNVARGWVAAHPDWADVPGVDVELTGINYVTNHPISAGSARSTTGAFRPLGQRCEPGERVAGAARCGGAIYRLALDGAEPERLAWGLRNPVGVACGPDGSIFATEGGMEERGSRPIAGAPDNLWEIRPGSYYGWPDHASGIPVTDSRFRLPGHPQPRRLLNNAPEVAGQPVTTFAPRSGVGRFDFSHSQSFGFVGEFVVALSGEWSAAAYPGEDVAPSGYRVVRVDPRTGAIRDFLVNRQGAPSSAGNTGGLERPFDICFDPSGEVLYVVDLGEVRLNRECGLEPFGRTGVVWRITKIQPMVSIPAAAPAAEGGLTDDEGDEDEGPEEGALEGEVDETGTPLDTESTEAVAEETHSAPEVEATTDETAAAPPTEAEEAPGEPVSDEETQQEPAEPEVAETVPESAPAGAVFNVGDLSSEELPLSGSPAMEQPPLASSEVADVETAAEQPEALEAAAPSEAIEPEAVAAPAVEAAPAADETAAVDAEAVSASSGDAALEESPIEPVAEPEPSEVAAPAEEVGAAEAAPAPTVEEAHENETPAASEPEAGAPDAGTSDTTPDAHADGSGEEKAE